LDCIVSLHAYSRDTTATIVRVGGEEVPAELAGLPFVEGSDRSARIPEY
jgi:aminomethyltransferase